MDLLAKVWPQWKTVKELGEGSFGKVYEIERKDVGGTYKAALKVITIPKTASEVNDVLSEGMDMNSATQYFHGMMEEIVKEFAMMEKLKGNTNIVAYEDHEVVDHVDSIGWDILIRMELLTTLSDYMVKHELSEKDVVKLGIDICKALELCQQYNIIHRDIKPENIFVSDLGDFKLGDFGVARTAEKTMSGMSKKGTYTYMAPEVYKGEAYNATVDLYSLGIVLYRLVNDYRTPFLPPVPEVITFNDRERAQARRMDGEELPKPSKASEGLAAIIHKACAYNAKDRYADATQMRVALEALLKGEVVAPKVAPVAEAEDRTVAMTATASVAAAAVSAEKKIKDNIVDEDKTVSMQSQTIAQPTKASAQVSVPQKSVANSNTVQATVSQTGSTTAEAANNTGKKKKIGLFAGIGAAAAALIIGGVVLLGGDKDGGNGSAQGDSQGGSGQGSVVQESTGGEDGQEGTEEVVSDVKAEDIRILAKQFGVDASDNWFIPEESQADWHNNHIYHPISMLGWWVPEDPTYRYSYEENFHPAEGSRIVIGMNEEGPIEVECLPITLDLQPFYLTGDSSTVDIEDANFGGMYLVDAYFMENHSEENKICEDVEVYGFFDTHEDTLALGFESEMASENVVNLQETHYEISWTGYKLTLTYGDYSMTYVPYTLSDDFYEIRTSKVKDMIFYGGHIDGYMPIDGLGHSIECHIPFNEESNGRGRTTFYDPEFCLQYATIKCYEDGTMIVDTEEDKSSNYIFPARHLELTYRASQDAFTVISEDAITVYSHFSDAYWDYVESLVGDDVDESMSEEQVNQVVENKNTILQKLKEAFDAAGIAVDIDESTGKVSMDSSILFGHDDSTLSQEGKDFLDKFLGVYASVILSDECAGFVSQIEVEGHTDTSGAYDYNLVLSKKRADSVANYCLQESNSGLDATQLAAFGNMMTTVGRSYDEPVYNADGTVNMDASRRVVFRFRLNTDV